jgi:Ca2+-binding RTX toxin-like protein
VAVRADGSVLVVGRFGEQKKRLGVKRLTAGGAPDAGYGDAGTAVPGFQENPIAGSLVPAALRPDGRLALAAIDVDYNLAVTRFGATGAFDPVFGAGGTTTVDFGGVMIPTAATVQRDGKLLIAGATIQNLRPRLAFARVLGDATVPSGGGPGTPPPPVLRCAGRRATIIGTAGRDRLRGTRRADVIVALGGNDRVVALGGNDVVCGGAGDDRLSGGAGRDALRGERGRDRLLGGSGRDRLIGGPGRDRVRP